ncbi:YbbR-like domain-containing protein [Pleomorphovibrio marinus]|uniref:YbbR-like domain-containing protein n=1 Tax=Pleomorphovibrio marinus TaxID=2164132 RepID=UPI000E0B104E|nr:YbbR-like domain-containing protein [Pleomorphovibrio marinus]
MSNFRKFFKKLKPEKSSNIKVVVLCVFTATTFWVLNALNKEDYSTIVSQPIRIEYNQEEFQAVEELPGYVQIEIHGNGWDLLRKYFQFNVTPFVIELEDPSRNGYVLTRDVRRELTEVIAPTQLVNIVQDSIHFKVDRLVTRKINVVVDTTENTLAQNFRYASPIKIDPEVVAVRGPISIVQSLEGQLLLELPDDEIKSNYSKLLPLTVPRDKRSFLSLEEETVQVDFEVVQFVDGSKRLTLEKKFFPANVSVEQEDISSVMLFYLVDERHLEDLEKLDLQAVLNFHNRNREDSTVNVSLNLNPNYLEIQSFVPEKFKLIYE